MYDTQIKALFASISSKIAKPSQGFFESHIDQTITVENLINFLIKQGLLHNVCRPLRTEADLDPNQTISAHEAHETSNPVNISHNQSNVAPASAADHDLTPEELEQKLVEEERIRQEEESKYDCPDNQVKLSQVIFFIEKYYNETSCLANKVRDISDDDINRDHKIFKITAKHYLNIKGVELVLHEFKEILLEISILISSRASQLEEGQKPKVRAQLKKFIDEFILTGQDFSQYKKSQPPRVWPQSFKSTCKKLADEKKRKEEEEKQKQSDAIQQKEKNLMSLEDFDAPMTNETLDQHHFSHSPDQEEQAIIQGGAPELSDDDVELEDDEDVSGDDY